MNDEVQIEVGAENENRKKTVADNGKETIDKREEETDIPNRPEETPLF